MDRRFFMQVESGKYRIESWTELMDLAFNEPFNNLIFGSGQLRVQFLKPTSEELELMEFLNGIRFLENEKDASGVEAKIEMQPTKVFRGTAINSTLIKKSLDERVKPLEESTVVVKESIVELKSNIVSGLKEMKDQLVEEIWDILRQEIQKITPGLQHGVHDLVDDARQAEVNDYGGGDFTPKDTSPVVADVVIEKCVSQPEKMSLEQYLKVRDYPSFALLSQDRLDEVDCPKKMEDVRIIEHLEKSVEKSVEKGLHRGILATSAMCKSPFTTEFGSAECKEMVVYHLKAIRKGLSSFSDEFQQMPNKEDEDKFDQWFKIGLINRKK